MKDQPEWWGGVECTVNRVNDTYHEQLERSGHAGRLSDLERIAELGVTRLRFPVLWERTFCPRREACDFSWADSRLQRVRELGLDPIVGLLHHGSGPLFTHLLDPGFAEAFAAFAGEVARRYPWVTRFTPINEILTTARFSALYGHWYPHARDDRSFVRALLTEVRATQLGMRAIRQVNPSAQLVTTEDLGTVFATARLAYQAQFENARRWLSMDLLAGRVDSEHELYEYLTEVGGATAAELERIREEATEPDLIGINYYVTSDRFLDHRTELYPPHLHGGNGSHCYADVEAVRLEGVGIVGHYETLRTVWQRYRRPVALTEVHLGCCEEHEQVRWLEDAWSDACRARRDGIDVRAVTAWSLFGAFDWNSLVTRSAGHYEPGAFDVRFDPPRATAVAHTIGRLTRAGAAPLTGVLGWWRRKERCLYPAYESMASVPRVPTLETRTGPRPPASLRRRREYEPSSETTGAVGAVERRGRVARRRSRRATS